MKKARIASATLGLALALLALPAAASAQQIFPSAEFPTGPNPTEIDSADINGDGFLDCVTADYFGPSASLLLGTGGGAFYPPSPLAVGSAPAGIALGDLDGNGTIDIVTANQASANVTVLLNSGGGVFGVPLPYGAGSNPESVSIADFNVDGKADLAVANLTSNNVSVLLGTGGGVFAAATNYAVQTSPVKACVGDFNGDLRPDLAVVNQASSTVSVLLANPAGGFATAVNYTVGSGPHDVIAIDYTGDGKLDLAIACLNAGTLATLPGTGSGTFAAATQLNAGAGPATLSAGDLNGDGKPDLTVTRPNANLLCVFVASGSSYAPVVNYPSGADANAGTLGDFDGDGRLDFVAANYKQCTVSVFPGNGAGGFVAAAVYGTINAPRAIGLGDFDGDGAPDLIASHDNNIFLSYGKGNGTGGFGQLASNIQVSFITNDLSIADVDLDGNLDIVASNPPSQISVLLGSGAGTFAAPSAVPVGGIPQYVAVSDVNADGIPDLVPAWTAAGNDNVSLFLGIGGGAFTFVGDTPLAGAPMALAMGDLNHDGLPDAIVAEAPSQLSVFYSQGFGFSAPTPLASLPNIGAIAAGDLDLDGVDDLTVAHGTTPGTLSVFLASSGFASPTPYGVESTPSGIALADYDHDGVVDIAVCNKFGALGSGTTGSVSILRGVAAGSGSFFPIGVFGVARSPLGIESADLDGDGRCDLVIANNAVTSPTQSITVLLNRAAVGPTLVHFGAGSPGCFGKLGMNTSVPPVIGAPGFSFTCTNAPRSSLGVVLIGTAADLAGSDPLFLGFKFHVDVFNSPTLIGADCFSDAGGTALTIPGQIPNDPGLIGAVFVAQALWVEDSGAGQACGASFVHLVSSEGLQVTIQ